LLAFKIKNHFTMNNDLFKHFNENIWDCGNGYGLKYFLLKNKSI
jgi:hypothetical protein